MVSSSCSAVGREKSMSRVVRRAKELQQVDGKQFGDQTLDQMKLLFSENNRIVSTDGSQHAFVKLLHFYNSEVR